MDIEFWVNDGDIAALRAAVKRHVRESTGFTRNLLMGIVAGGLAMGATYIVFEFTNLQSSPYRVLAFSLLLAVTAGAYLLMQVGGLRWPRKAPHTADKLYRITLTPLGWNAACNGHAVEHSWDQLHELQEGERHFFIFINPYRGYVIPKHAFVSAEQAYGFVNTLRGYWSQAPENGGHAWLDRPNVKLWITQRHLDLRANFLAALQLILLKPVNASDFKTNTTQLTRLIVLNIAAGIGIQYLGALPQPQFNFFSFPQYGIEVSLFLLSGWVVARLMGDVRSAARFLVMVSAASILLALPVAAVTVVAQLWPSTIVSGLAWMVGMLYLVWTLVVAFRAIMLLYRPTLSSATVATSVYALLSFFVLLTLPDTRLFYSPPVEDKKVDTRLNVEDTFYSQSKLMRAAADALTPERPGVTDLFFIGFAGEARERVFSNEVNYVRKLFDTQFDTTGHSLILVNNKETVSNVPIASVNNLRVALQTVAARMDKTNDVLFLFLTSHGSRRHDLSVEFWPLDLNILPAARLKSLLDESGIVNRVIVVSACFSGGFIDALQDDHSLIITAAARDKTSFGCGAKSKFTYFGEAYFKEALKSNRSFSGAFELAKASIEKREQSENIEASHPQIYVGSKIEAVLDRLPR